MSSFLKFQISKYCAYKILHKLTIAQYRHLQSLSSYISWRGHSMRQSLQVISGSMARSTVLLLALYTAIPPPSDELKYTNRMLCYQTYNIIWWSISLGLWGTHSGNGSPTLQSPWKGKTLALWLSRASALNISPLQSCWYDVLSFSIVNSHLFVQSNILIHIRFYLATFIHIFKMQIIFLISVCSKFYRLICTHTHFHVPVHTTGTLQD